MSLRIGRHILCYCASLPDSTCDFCSQLRKGTLSDFRDLIGSKVQGRFSGHIYTVVNVVEISGRPEEPLFEVAEDRLTLSLADIVTLG